jgi:hypothetical protein
MGGSDKSICILQGTLRRRQSRRLSYTQPVPGRATQDRMQHAQRAKQCCRMDPWHKRITGPECFFDASLHASAAC